MENTEKYNYPLYKNIRKRRKELHMTQGKLAERLEYCGKSMISKIENGKVDLTYSKIVAFAAALETTEAALCGWTAEGENTAKIISKNTETSYLKAAAEAAALKVSEDSAYHTGS